MPKIVDHDQYRKELLSKCFELFSRKGYSNVTMREIARELQVSTGTLYHYFPTKKTLFEQLFEYEGIIDIERIMNQIRDLDDRKKIIDIVIRHWDEKKDFYQNIMLLAIDFYRSNDTVPDQVALVQFSDFYRKTIAEYMKFPLDLASLIFIFVIGLMYHTLMVPGSVDFLEQLNLLKRFIVIDMDKQSMVNEDHRKLPQKVEI